MSEDKEQKNKQVDLSSLENLEFSTAWSPSVNYGKSEARGRGDFRRDRDFKRGERGGHKGEREFKKREFSPRRDDNSGGERRPRRFEKSSDETREGGSKFAFRKGAPRGKFTKPFELTMEVLLYPEDAPFAKLVDVMKHLKRTYQLFDIAELVIEKQERFIVLAKNLPSEDGAIKPLYCAQPENLPFEDENEAKRVAVEHFIEQMFEKQEVECEAPKGSFQVVHRTTLTGDLLGAPNWHKYGENLREYHAKKFPNMPYEKFLSSIESVRDEAVIAAWLEQMKKREVYKLKDSETSFESRSLAGAYILEQKGEELVKTYEQVRMHGADIAKLPANSRIRRNIEAAWQKQKRFPIITANNLRGRLRRAGFTIYKRGSKGFAFVCSVKRKFLFEGDTLSEIPQKIYDFVGANQGVKAAALPFLYLGLKAPEGLVKAAPLAEEHKKQVEAGEEVSPLLEVEAAPELSAEETAQLNKISAELMWLISEGYVVEYADSSLQANPVLPRPKDKSSKTIASDAESIVLGVEDEPLVAETKPTPAEDLPEEEASEEEGGNTNCPTCQSESDETTSAIATDDVEEQKQ